MQGFIQRESFGGGGGEAPGNGCGLYTFLYNCPKFGGGGGGGEGGSFPPTPPPLDETLVCTIQCTDNEILIYELTCIPFTTHLGNISLWSMRDMTACFRLKYMGCPHSLMSMNIPQNFLYSLYRFSTFLK